MERKPINSQLHRRHQIAISTRAAQTLPPGLFLKPAPAEAFIHISVQDTGEGILPDNLPRIFEPFFTTKSMSSQRGTGLGLSMVYELARKLEAGLAVESEPGKGSTFTLILPVKAP
jgi:signal transduction histidine kinase